MRECGQGPGSPEDRLRGSWFLIQSLRQCEPDDGKHQARQRETRSRLRWRLHRPAAPEVERGSLRSVYPRSRSGTPEVGLELRSELRRPCDATCSAEPPANQALEDSETEKRDERGQIDLAEWRNHAAQRSQDRFGQRERPAHPGRKRTDG